MILLPILLLAGIGFYLTGHGWLALIALGILALIIAIAGD